jgi:hypothetical protein
VLLSVWNIEMSVSKIWGFGSGEDVDRGLVGCDAVCFSETLGPIYKTTRRHNPEDHDRLYFTSFRIDYRGCLFSGTYFWFWNVMLLCLEGVSATPLPLKCFEQTKLNSSKDVAFLTKEI